MRGDDRRLERHADELAHLARAVGEGFHGVGTQRLIFVPDPLLMRASNLMPPRLIEFVCLTSALKFAPPMLIVDSAPSLRSEEN